MCFCLISVWLFIIAFSKRAFSAYFCVNFYLTPNYQVTVNPKIYISMYSPFCGNIAYSDNNKLINEILKDDGDLGKRIENINFRIKKTYSILTTKKDFDADEDLSIFIAPEWYFRNRDSIYSFEDLGTIIKNFKKLSKECKSMLIIPGSVHYTDGKEDHTNKQLIYNCCPVFCDGELLSIVYKYYEAGDIIDSSKEKWGFWRANAFRKLNMEKVKIIENKSLKIFEPINGINRYFTCKKIKAGIEICADSDFSILKDAVGKNDLDLQFLISCGANYLPKSCTLHLGGYFIHCDGNMSKSKDNLINCTNVMKCVTHMRKQEVIIEGFLNINEEKECFDAIDSSEVEDEKYYCNSDIILFKSPLIIKKKEKVKSNIETFIEKIFN